jgi:AraC-like DNA-binding protein
MRQLCDAMENDKLYLDPELSLDKVADHLRIPAKSISVTLNQHYQRSFNDFVNDCRIREVKERLVAPQNDHLTILGIALESGFNSQATFQRAFKNMTGHSPREYLNLKSKNNGYAKHEKTSQIRI